ncbi:MAG TPA: hypothetical protein VNO43_16855 [Candidatus Eisenbacteria bacterium]|nr:hypothetical protein [Candidatus Eisenbacteria bacterium]
MKKRFFKAALATAIAVLCAFILIDAIVKTDRFKQWARAEIAARTGYDVSVSSFTMLPPFRLSARDVTVSKFSKTLLQSDQLVITINPLDFLSRTIHRIRLQNPVLRLDIENWMSPPAPAPGALAVRHLNVENATVVLTTVPDSRVEFRGIRINAQNLNAGESGRLSLRAEVPALAGSADVTVQQSETEVTAAVHLQQHRRGRVFDRVSADPPAGSLQADFQLRRDETGILEITGAGRSEAFTLAGGEVSGTFDLGLRRGAASPQADVSLDVRLTDFPRRLDRFPITIPEGATTLRLEGLYGFERHTLEVKAVRVASPLGSAEGNGRIVLQPQLRFSSFRASIRDVPVENLKSFFPEPLRNWNYRGAMAAEVEIEGPWESAALKGVTRASGLGISAEGVSIADLRLNGPWEWSDGSLRSQRLILQAKRVAVETNGSAQFSAAELRFEGDVETGRGGPAATGRLQLTGGRFALPGANKIGENFAAAGRIAAAFDMARRVSLTGRVSIANGQLLWGKFFADLKAYRPTFAFDGEYRLGDDVIQLRRFNVAAAAIGRVDLSGTIEQFAGSRLFTLEAASRGLDAGALFDSTVRETFNQSHPFLNQLKIAGRLGFSMKVRGDRERLVAEGALELRQAAIRTDTGRWEIGPLTLNLPFRVHLPAPREPAASAEARFGRLAIAEARIGSEAVGAVESGLTLWDNALRFRDPVMIPVFGGVIALSHVVWPDVIADPRALSLSVQARDVQLERLTRSLNWPSFGGTLAGSIPRMAWDGSALRSDGEIRINVFGGQARIGSLEIENPFSSLPSIRLNLRFHDIHLDQASESFAFGRISGILEGRFDDLVVTDGQPARFRGEVRTVERSDSDQWISVEALNNITVLSSGNDATALYAGLAGLFENFRYSKLGFKATLRNDKLTLRGVETRDDKEYLVVGSWIPPTVNIISHTQEIGFSELLRRLERIGVRETPKAN